MSFTRRDFASALGAGMALSRIASAVPRGWQTDSGRKIGYCIVGLGRISLGHFMPACRMSQRSQVVAIVSGHRDKAEKPRARQFLDAAGADPLQAWAHAADVGRRRRSCLLGNDALPPREVRSPRS